MNEARRNTIRALETRMETELATKVAQLLELVEELKTGYEEVRDEEQEYMDNMPESLQSSDKGETAQRAIDALTEVCDELESLESTLGEVGVANLVGKSDEAKE